MKTGDRTQAIVLSVAAIGAIGFLVTRLIPAKAANGAAASELSHSSTTRVASDGGLPTEIVRDAFSHPAITARFLAAKPLKDAGAETPTQDESSTANKPLPIAGFLDYSGSKAARELADLEHRMRNSKLGEPKKGAKPSGNTETDQQVEKVPTVKIGLKAIMSGNKTLALISLDGGPGLMVGPGVQLTGRYRIGKFSQNAVQLVSASGITWLYVGQELEK